MLRYFLGFVAILLALVLGLGYFAKADPKKLARALRTVGGIALLGLAVVLVARGLIIYAIPLAIAGYALMQGRSPFPSGFPGGGGKSTGQHSRVRTDYLEMRLDHDSGDIEGLVLKGQFANRMLTDLTREELLALWSECRQHDAQAAQLLEAFLDKAHADWRDAAEAADAGGSAPPSGGGGPMSAEEAYDVLGLARGASDSEIRRAHRTLMKKLHPDQGGSTYLASKINEAKDILLKR